MANVDIAPIQGVQRGGGVVNGVAGQDTAGISAVDSFGGNIISSDSRKPAYAWSVSAFTPVATPTAFMVIQGSATKTVRIRRIIVTGAATAAGNLPLVITRRSTAGTLGSAVLTAITAAKHDVNDAAPTAVVSTVGTANYGTLGTTAGQIAAGRISMTALGSGVGITPLEFDYGRTGKSLVLRGASDFITLEGAGGTVPSGGVLDITVVADEDNS